MKLPMVKAPRAFSAAIFAIVATTDNGGHRFLNAGLVVLTALGIFNFLDICILDYN